MSRTLRYLDGDIRDYRNFFMEDGVHYDHTIDSVTGRPVRHRLAAYLLLHQGEGTKAVLTDSFKTLTGEIAP